MSQFSYDLAVAYRINPKMSAHPPPIFAEDKFKLAELCLKSFKNSLGGLRVKVWALLNNCPPEYEAMFKKLWLAEDLALVRFPGVAAGTTLHEQSRILAEQTDAEIAYFAEDDYFYLPGQFQQAVNFLNVVGDPANTLIVLDFESNPTGPSMSLEEARAFITHTKDATGRYPGFYSGHDIKQALGTSSDPVLAECWFWLAQYGPTAVVPPNWNTWTLWQYTDGAIGPEPKQIPGLALFDRDLFNGSEDELRTFWGS